MKILAQNIELGIGTHFLSSKTSVQASKGNELECTPLGVIATSGKNGMRILIPWSNVRGAKLFPEVKSDKPEGFDSLAVINQRLKPGPKPKAV